MQTDIYQYNEMSQRHGYWEVYYPNGQLDFKGEYVNGNKHGYWEYYCGNGELWYKGTFDMGKRIGYWSYNGEKLFYAN